MSAELLSVQIIRNTALGGTVEHLRAGEWRIEVEEGARVTAWRHDGSRLVVPWHAVVSLAYGPDGTAERRNGARGEPGTGVSRPSETPRPRAKKPQKKSEGQKDGD